MPAAPRRQSLNVVELVGSPPEDDDSFRTTSTRPSVLITKTTAVRRASLGGASGLSPCNNSASSHNSTKNMHMQMSMPCTNVPDWKEDMFQEAEAAEVDNQVELETQALTREEKDYFGSDHQFQQKLADLGYEDMQIAEEKTEKSPRGQAIDPGSLSTISTSPSQEPDLPATAATKTTGAEEAVDEFWDSLRTPTRGSRKKRSTDKPRGSSNSHRSGGERDRGDRERRRSNSPTRLPKRASTSKLSGMASASSHRVPKRSSSSRPGVGSKQHSISNLQQSSQSSKIRSSSSSNNLPVQELTGTRPVRRTYSRDHGPRGDHTTSTRSSSTATTETMANTSYGSGGSRRRSQSTTGRYEEDDTISSSALSPDTPNKRMLMRTMSLQQQQAQQAVGLQPPMGSESCPCCGGGAQQQQVQGGAILSWTCKCGYTIDINMKFCGKCGAPRNWTCKDCQYDQNLCDFAFCGQCGMKRSSNHTGTSRRRRKDQQRVSMVEVVSVLTRGGSGDS